MTRPTVMQAIEAAKYLRRIAITDMESHSAVRTLLDYTQAYRWRFGWNVTDFGDIVAHVGPPESFDGLQRHYESISEALAAADKKYGDDVANELEEQFKLMGVV